MKVLVSFVAAACFCVALSLAAQTSTSNATQTQQVPHLVKFSGTVQGSVADKGENGVILGTGVAPTNVVAITFALYAEQTGGAPLWSEVQNVHVDATGHYNVQLGSTKPDGLPVELFTSAQAQWLGVQLQGQAEQPRVMLLSVPYALKAADAETFGGKPPSAYIQVANSGSTSGSTSATGAATNDTKGGVQNDHPLSLTGSGVPNYLAVWSTGNTLGPSTIWNTRWVGIFSHTPAAPLEVDSDGQSGPNVQVTATGNANGLLATSAATSGNAYGVGGSSASTTGIGVYGKVSATTGQNFGVAGSAASSGGVGVAGVSNSTTGSNVGVVGQDYSASGAGVQGSNFATSGNAIGVVGSTSSTGGVAVLGTGVGSSAEGNTVTLRPAGVWGDTDQASGIGVLATADFGIAFAGYNDAENISTAKFQNDESTDEVGNVLATKGGHFHGICVMDVGGNLGCSGSKSAVVPVDGGTRKVALYAVEAPDNWFEDFGSAQLSRGSAVVQLEPVFGQTVNSSVEYHVFLTPKGDCKGLYVTNETADSFEVRELGGGTASVGFDYRIIARRKGYENIRLADRTKQFNSVDNEPRPQPGKVAAPKLPHPIVSLAAQK